MKKSRIYLICLALVLVTVLYAALSSAQRIGEQSGPTLQEGQIFVVKLTPGAKRLEFLVTGREMVKLELSDLGLKAAVRMPGGKTLVLVPERKGGAFVVDHPASASSLDLEIRYRERAETFEFPLQNRRH